MSPPLLADATNVYFNDTFSYGFCPGSGCSTSTPVLNEFVSEATRDSKNAYLFQNANVPEVLSCPLGAQCGSPQKIASVADVSFATDGVSLYWFDNESILSCPVSGCNPSPVVIAVNQVFPGALLADATSVYWVSDHRIMKVAK